MGESPKAEGRDAEAKSLETLRVGCPAIPQTMTSGSRPLRRWRQLISEPLDSSSQRSPRSVFVCLQGVAPVWTSRLHC